MQSVWSAQPRTPRRGPYIIESWRYPRCSPCPVSILYFYCGPGVARILRTRRRGPPRPRRPRRAGARRCRPETRAATAGALMRVNHAGEMAAQALYHGQAFVARNAATRDCCCRRPGRRPTIWPGASSVFGSCSHAPACSNPLWYAGSFAIGALAGCVWRPDEPRLRGRDRAAGRRSPGRASAAAAGRRLPQPGDPRADARRREGAWPAAPSAPAAPSCRPARGADETHCTGDDAYCVLDIVDVTRACSCAGLM